MDIHKGDRATVLAGHDRFGGTIIAAGAERIVVQRDKAKRVDDFGMGSRKQRYVYKRDTKGPTFTFHRAGRRLQSKQADGLILGVRNEFHSTAKR